MLGSKIKGLRHLSRVTKTPKEVLFMCNGRGMSWGYALTTHYGGNEVLILVNQIIAHELIDNLLGLSDTQEKMLKNFAEKSGIKTCTVINLSSIGMMHRHGIFGHVFFQMLLEIVFQFFGGLVAGTKHHKRLDPLHFIIVFDADDGGHQNSFMGVDHVFHLRGVYVVAGGDDHALEPLLEVHKSLLIHGTQVAGVQPYQAVLVELQRLSRFLGIVHITRHDGRTGDADLAHLAVRHLVVGGGNDDLVIGIGERNADRAFFIEVFRSQAACSDAFRGSVALTDLLGGTVGFEKCVHLMLELDGERVAAGEYAFQLAQIQIICFLQAEKRLIERRNASDIVGPMLFQQICIGIHGELGHKDAGAAVDQHGMDADAQTKTVEDGHDGKHFVAGNDAVSGGASLHAQRVEVQIAQENSLRGSGGAAAVEDRGGIPGADRVLDRSGEAVSGLQEILPEQNQIVIGGDLCDLTVLRGPVSKLNGAGQRVADPGDDQLFDMDLVPDGVEFTVELVQRQRGDRLALVEVEGNLFLSGQGMDHICNAAHIVEGIKRHDRLRGVGHTDGHPVAGLHAHGPEHSCTALDLLDQLCIGGFDAEKVERHDVRPLLRALLHQVSHGAVWIFQMHRDTVHVGGPGGFYFTVHRESPLQLEFLTVRDGTKDGPEASEILQNRTHPRCVRRQ